MTLFDLGQRFIGEIKEIPGPQDHPYIRWAHSLTSLGESPDEIAWCSSFLNSLAWLLRLPRSKSAAARSWLTVGRVITRLDDARVGYDVVILNRNGPQDANVINAPGHVGLYAGHEGQFVVLLAGNQGNAVSVAHFPVSQILGIRRLKELEPL